jgi:Nif-specific regulatory protein
MPAIRSILWIGAAERFPAESLAELPTLDVVWERRVEETLGLSLGTFDAVVIDLARAADSLAALRALRSKRACPPVLVGLAAEESRCVPELLAGGATDAVLRTPGANAELLVRLEKLGDGGPGPEAPVRRRPRPRSPSSEIVGDSPEMREVFALVACASRSRATVLLSGETGTGKELIARAIHRGSDRRGGAFVAVNCAAFPDTLLESELFGHARGSFTGADRDKPGLFLTADGGTIFLDEVSETSGPFQAKLLRVLQEREVRPVGGTRPRRVDARIVAATNRDLWSEATNGRFRDDLYYRLAVFRIHVPPLRRRPGDVLPLAEHFLALHGAWEGKTQCRLAAEAAQLLQAYAWPGNVRELENEIQRALALLDPGGTLTPDHCSERLSGLLEPIDSGAPRGESLRESLDRIEALLIRRALASHDGRRAQTARQLGITREGLYKKMKRLHIE